MEWSYENVGGGKPCGFREHCSNNCFRIQSKAKQAIRQLLRFPSPGPFSFYAGLALSSMLRLQIEFDGGSNDVSKITIIFFRQCLKRVSGSRSN
jgi:hypothetical protein